MSPWLIVAPPTCTGSPMVPGMSLVAPLIRTQRAQIGSPSSARVSMSRTAASMRIPAAPWALAWVASRSPTIPIGRGSGIVSTSTSPG